MTTSSSHVAVCIGYPTSHRIHDGCGVALHRRYQLAWIGTGTCMLHMHRSAHMEACSQRRDVIQVTRTHRRDMWCHVMSCHTHMHTSSPPPATVSSNHWVHKISDVMEIYAQSHMMLLTQGGNSLQGLQQISRGFIRRNGTMQQHTSTALAHPACTCHVDVMLMSC